MINSKPRVLYLCTRLPATIQGGLDLRVRNQILTLLENCEVSVFTLNTTATKIDQRIAYLASGSDTKPLKPMDGQEAAKLLRTGAGPHETRFSKITAAELTQLIGQFNPDIAIISRIELMPYFEAIKNAGVPRIILDLDESVTRSGPSILSVIQNRAQALLWKQYGFKQAEYELESLNKVEEIWVSSEIEKTRIEHEYPRTIANPPRVSMVPNAIDVASYQKPPTAQTQEDLIIYPASFAYEPSLDAARFLIDELMPKLPNFKLQLVGSFIPIDIKNKETEQVQVVGTVPDMIPYFHGAGMIAIALRAGAGTRLKATEAMAAELPIVSTAFGVEGHDMVPGVHYLLAETADEFAEACQRIREDKELRQRLVANAKQLVTEQLSLPVLIEAVEKAIA